MIYFAIMIRLMRPLQILMYDDLISDDIEGTKDEDIKDGDNNLDKKYNN